MRKLVIRFNAPATLTFALLALGALLLGQTFGSAVTMKYFCVYRASLADPLTYLRFFTHVLGHADYSHYMSNMLLLLLVGPPLEEKYGWKKMVWFMAATALVTGLVQFIFFPNSALLGASGIVFMMIVLSSFTEMGKEGIPADPCGGWRAGYDLRLPLPGRPAALRWFCPFSVPVHCWRQITGCGAWPGGENWSGRFWADGSGWSCWKTPAWPGVC